MLTESSIIQKANSYIMDVPKNLDIFVHVNYNFSKLSSINLNNWIEFWKSAFH